MAEGHPPTIEAVAPADELLAAAPQARDPGGTIGSRCRPRRQAVVRAPLYAPAVARYLHTMVRVTDPDRSRAFYEALGMEFRRELPIVREGHHEATNYFMGFPDQDEELELTWNTD